MFQRILIANRGEIALRIIRACRELGIESVVTFSEADRDAPYLRLADRAICVGPASGLDSYLKIDRIISAAEVADVQAIHPGYGFLAENSQFAEMCRSSRIEFIGPPESAMRKFGNKSEARRLAQETRVQVVPGSREPIADEREAIDIAHKIGFPILIKAAAGGGGRGMRPVHNDMSLRAAVSQARQEAQAAFKDASVYLEKLVERPRHVEVQILGDQHGHLVHLWDRDCTVQRRYQKLVEQSPAPGVPASVRGDICKAAVRLAKAAGYYNAGTVEFIVDQSNQFYFIEGNARIQVEHPVTEMVTGVDLVKQQLRIASGEPLDISQRSIKLNGATIECRINAEDPEKGFKPCPGTITRWDLPGGPGVRVDSHVCAGYTVSPHYDTLIAKLIVHGHDRAEAIARMQRALDEFVIEGVKTTIPLHQHILSHTDFIKGQVDTGFVERTWQDK